jgi:hypothetical protein
MKRLPRLLPIACVLLAACLSATPGAADGTEGAAENDVPGADSAGPRTCAQAVRCAQDKGCYQPMCVGTCLEGTDSAVKLQAQGILKCEADNCAGVAAGTESALALCVYDLCRAEIEPCTAKGTKTCQATLACIWGSYIGGTSPLDCLDEAAYESRLQVLAVTACVESQCPYAIIGGMTDVSACLGGPCKADYSACL